MHGIGLFYRKSSTYFFDGTVATGILLKRDAANSAPIDQEAQSVADHRARKGRLR
jgi:hypothetical protein